MSTHFQAFFNVYCCQQAKLEFLSHLFSIYFRLKLFFKLEFLGQHLTVTSLKLWSVEKSAKIPGTNQCDGSEAILNGSWSGSHFLFWYGSGSEFYLVWKFFFQMLNYCFTKSYKTCYVLLSNWQQAKIFFGGEWRGWGVSEEGWWNGVWFCSGSGSVGNISDPDTANWYGLLDPDLQHWYKCARVSLQCNRLIKR